MKDEFKELQLLEDDAIVTAVDGRQRRLDHVWGEVMAMQTGMGAVRFPALTTVYTALLGLLYSNADSERTFSMLHKLHTDSRSNLLPKTITAYLQCKMNVDSCCYQMEVTPAMARVQMTTLSETNKKLCVTMSSFLMDFLWIFDYNLTGVGHADKV